MENRREIAKQLAKADPRTRAEVDAFKRRLCKQYGIAYPSNLNLLAISNSSLRGSDLRKIERLRNLLRVRPIRSLSGIVNVSVLTKPYPCPGRCLYCPNEPGMPKSYLTGEPAAERAKRLKFNPYNQVRRRLEMLSNEGHSIDKIELRVIGGTWSYYPRVYQKKFIRQCLRACNKFGGSKKGLTLLGLKGLDPLKAEQKTNETAKCRIVGISIETRPDYIDEREITRLRVLGVTRVELGVQNIYDDVLKLNRRGHKVDAVIHATKLLKDAGFKVSYQIMLNLPGSTPARDLAMAKEVFSNPDFCPDLIKIYPCMVLKEAPLYKLYRQGKHKPYSRQKLLKTIKEIKKIVPPYVRIERIIRDIPAPRITGQKQDISNLRQFIAREMEREGWTCQCIRCREIKGNYDPKEKKYLVRRDYNASGGKEIFLSFENKLKTKLFSLLRLRISPRPCLCELSEIRSNNSAIVREIHTYGLQTPIGGKSASIQHRGLGKKMIEAAEKIAGNEFGAKKIAVISGIGARAYWRKLGYKLKNSYMVKTF